MMNYVQCGTSETPRDANSDEALRVQKRTRYAQRMFLTRPAELRAPRVGEPAASVLEGVAS